MNSNAAPGFSGSVRAWSGVYNKSTIRIELESVFSMTRSKGHSPS
ncbi:MAG: hypothetical protein ABIQ35_07215 [Verrucomicrobiota bacterium]